MTKLLLAAVLMLGFWTAAAQTAIREQAYELELPASWGPVKSVAPGFDRGYERALAQGSKAVILLHHEVMLAGAGDPPEDTSEMARQFENLVRNQYPDARAAGAPAFKVAGRTLVNAAYDVTEAGLPVRKSYTYFLAGRTVMVVQCTAPREQWAEASGEFGSILATLRAVDGERQPKLSDAAALERLRKRLPALASIVPAEWACEIRDVAILRPPSGPEGGTLSIRVAFRRGDIGEVYESAKVLFTATAGAQSEAELTSAVPAAAPNHKEDVPGLVRSEAAKALLSAIASIGSRAELSQSVPAAVRDHMRDVPGLMKYVGELWGMAWGVVADCERPIGRFQIVIEGAVGRTGAISLSAEDGLAVISGKITASDQTRVGKIYRFE